MSRETQFVGLTEDANNFVSELKRLDSAEFVQGMFGEEIALRKWEIHPLFKRENRPNSHIREVVQCIPWSSGPMIFTCLEIFWGTGFEDEGNTSKCYEWVVDPTLSAEFCQQRATEEYGEGVIITGGEEYDAQKGTMWF